MERGRLKQRLSQLFRASLRSSCGVSSRNAAVDAVQEPIFVSRRYDGDEDGELRRSLSLPPASTLGSLLRGRRDHETVLAAAPAGSQRQSVDCSCRPSAAARGSTLKKLKKKERRVLSTTGAGRSTCPPTSPSPSYYYLKQMEEEMAREEKRLAAKKKKKKKKGITMEKDHRGKRKGGGKKLLSNGYGFTSSSSGGSDNDDVGDCFSSDGPAGGGASRDKDADQVVFSSRSISSDSSEFYHTTSRRRPRSKKKASTRRHHQKPGRGDGFRPLVSISSRATGTAAAAAAAAVLVEEEEDMGKEGFAVEKESSDPYEDFRSSMLEMIVEKQMFAAAELERLLRCYLALNSPRHHPTIVEVFSEIWETLFRN